MNYRPRSREDASFAPAAFSHANAARGDQLALAAELLTAPPPTDSRLKRIIQRFGILGFLFFLIKGLAWLIVPALIAKSCTGD